MEAKVTAVENKGEEMIVTFSCDLGEGRAAWFGDEPETGKVYDVEMEFDDTLTWGRDIVPSKSREARMSIESGATRINARLESASEDGFTVVELGEDLYVLQTEGQIMPGEYMAFSAQNITLYDESIE